MDDSTDLPVLAPEVTYLREVALEGKELHDELRASGFTDKQATAIVANFIVDAVNSRDEEYGVIYVEYSDDDDEEDDDDYDRDSGI